MAREWNDVTFEDLTEQPVTMTIPADAVLSDLLLSAITELKDLPHISKQNELLVEAFTSLHSLLFKKTDESWSTADERSAFKKLPDAVQKILSLAAKWKRSKLRILLYWSTFADELSTAVTEIQRLFGRLQVRATKRELARAIVEKLGRVIQGLRDGGDGSELTIAATDFKEKLLDFLRVNQSKSETSEAVTSISSWIAKHVGSEVDSIRQELQEIKENADSTLHAEQNLDAELLEQLLLSLAVIEEKTAGESIILAEVKAKLKCGSCESLMICPVTVESGLSFCKSCIEERFRLGYSTCPVTKIEISKRFVINVALQNVISCFGESEEQPAPESSTEEGESSDANFEGVPFDEFSERKVQTGLEYLSSTTKPKVLTGFAHLIKCASLPGGPLAVANAKFIRPPPDPPIKAIPKVLELAKTQDPQYSKLAMKLMVALTSDKGPGPDSEITLEVADGLDVLISLMKEGRLTRTRLLAAETVANILLNRQVRKTVRSYNGIVPALVALSNVDPGCVSSKDLKKADTVCSKGLQRLAKCSKRGDKTQMIVAALLRLLRKGLSYQPELTSLVKDSLVALENIVLEIDNATSANEVLKVIWKEMSELLMTEGFEAHTTVPGRMAIISIMTKLCGLYKENINKFLFLYLLKMMKGTRTEIENLLAPSAPLPQDGNVEEQLKNLKKLLGRSVRLLCYCVTHGKETAQSVLSENVDERKTLEEMVHGENSGILDESRLEIQSILDQIYVKTTPATVVERIAILVKLSKSKDQGCRQQIAGKLRVFVAGKQNLSEFKEAGGIGALMALLQDSNPNCQRDALIALQELSLSVEIPVDQLPFQIILDFLDDKWPICERNAAVWLLDLIIKVPKGADMFVKTKGALEATLNLLKKDSDSPGSQKIATALLQMAKEDASVRRRIAEPGLRGLGILVKYVRDHVKDPSRIELKELLTATLVLFCGDGEACQEAVIEADGHMFLLTSVEEKISKEKSAQGLLELIRNTGTREKILEAGFVTVAMGSIDARFACTDIALGLSLLSSTPEGLNQIYSDPRSVPALLNLVEHCREPKGQDAAASVIARLYPRLNREEDLARQTKIAERCELFFKYLNPLDMSHLKEFLEALAAIAADMKGRKWIHEYRGHQLLIDNLSVTQTDIQGLMLKILAEMSSDVSENGAETRDAKRIRGAFMEHRIADKLFKLFESTEFLGRTENVKHALILIRNLSLAGAYVCEQLADQGVVTLLLGVLKRHESPLSVVTELAVKALEKFLDDPRGKQVFIKGGGIKSLAAVLKLDAFGRTGDAKSFSTIILAVFGSSQTSVAKDPQTRKYACETIFECDILSALNQIIFNGETSRIRWQAAVLMKLLAMYGPTKHVCSAMKAKGCLDALITLRNVQHCNEMANDVLKFVSEKSKDCKRYIDGRLAQLEN
ncbi:hypothetical protein M758_2G051200 [Ceratodon purpureus]|nr:hypothetical protein M758_2G051200 [Ceratodon purpureus]